MEQNQNQTTQSDRDFSNNAAVRESALRIGRYGVYWGSPEGQKCEDPLLRDVHPELFKEAVQ